MNVQEAIEKGRYDWVIVTGDAASGFHYHGPFVDYLDAQRYATRHDFGTHDICELIKPQG